MYYLIPLSFAFSNYIPSYNYIYLCQLLMSVLLIIVMLLFCFEMGVSLHSPVCSGAYYVDQIGQEFTKVQLSLPPKKGMCLHIWPQLLILYLQSIHSSNPKGNFIGLLGWQIGISKQVCQKRDLKSPNYSKPSSCTLFLISTIAMLLYI